MAKKAAASDRNPVTTAVRLLAEVRNGDTVYADLYLRRARELLGGVLPPGEYDALKRGQADIDEALKQSKVATMQHDWPRAESLAARVDDLRRRARENAELSKLGAAVYDAGGVSVDPFSPGFESLPGFDQDLAALRGGLVEQLKALAAADAPNAAFYESRGEFFAGLVLASKRATAAKAETQSTAEIEQLAIQAAQRGDAAQLRRYAKEIQARKAKEAAAPSDEPKVETAAVAQAAYQCPIDLSIPFSDEVATRARALGLAVTRTEPLPQSAPLFEFVTSRIGQARLSESETEREGAMRVAAAVDEIGFPAEASEPVKVLVGQFLRNPFISSGGARYIPLFRAETVLIEDFAEDQEPPTASELLSALHLERRRALARLEIEEALLRHGARVLEDLLLDPKEFRLVCVPQDLYTRFGRERGWGQQQQWTHFDGYQVLKSGQLRALVGGDARYGGLNDLISIATTDQRESVIARFAVIRRARQVARWR